jgi:hypothetical protein
MNNFVGRMLASVRSPTSSSSDKNDIDIGASRDPASATVGVAILNVSLWLIVLAINSPGATAADMFSC